MALPANFDVVNDFTLTDLTSGEKLTHVIVGVYPEEGRQYTGLNALWLIESTARCKREEDIPDWKESLANALHNIAVGIFERFSESKSPRDLDIVITLHRKIIALTPTTHPDYPTRMTNLASFIEDRYKHFGNAADLDHVVDLLRTVLFEWMNPPPTCPALDKWYYGYLSDTLTTRYNVRRTKELEYLQEEVEEVIALRRKIVELTPPIPVADYLKTLNALAQALAENYRVHKDENAMDEALQLQRTVLNLASLTINNAECSIYRQDLAEFLFARFGTVSQRKDDVDEMIGIYGQLIQNKEFKDPQTHLGTIHSHFATVLNERFHRTGNVEDLDHAISLQLQALELQGLDHPLRHNSLVLLGYMLRSQFVLTGRKETLDRAINCLREALQLVPYPHEDRPMVLNNLSIVMRRAFEEYDQYEYIREAIELEEEALKLPPTTDENRMSSLNNMAASLWAKYHRTEGKVDELDAIISFHEKALVLMSDKHPSYPFVCGNLGAILGIRLEKKRDLNEDDLRKSIKLIRTSLSAFDEHHPENCTMSGNLGVACFRMYGFSKDSDHLKEGVIAFRHATNHVSAPASQKFRAAKVWAAKAEEVEDPSALEAYRTTIELLPVLVAVNADLETRHQRLKSSIADTNGLGVAAAAYALKAGMVEDAVQFLEEGRALFWNQALKLRSPLSDLKDAHPDLAGRFQSVSKRLEISSYNTDQQLRESPSTPGFNKTTSLLTDHQASLELGHLKTEWDTILGEIRQKPGFDAFLQTSSTYSALQELGNALDGPVIMLCITHGISGAIVMTENSQEYLELPDISLGEVVKLVKLMQCVRVLGRSQNSDDLSDSANEILEALYRRNPELEAALVGDAVRKRPLLRHRPSRSSVLQHVLKELWTKIGKPVVQFLQSKKSKPLLRVYWCPTGPSTFLPIHAAGIYDTSNSSSTSESLMDYFVSSYIPTLGALINAFQYQRQEDKINDSQQKCLAIVQPQTLPSALEELERIEKRFIPDDKPHPNLSLIKLGEKPSNPATISSVLDHLSTSSIVHFACHGKQESGNPLDSALILEDGGLTLSRIMQVEMKGASLAFLCACETAMGEKEVPDESMHLGASLLFAGFQGVIATMWSIADIDGPSIADDFYGFLMDTNCGNSKEGSGLLATNRGARALHHAVLKLRLKGVPLERWVPFVYLGK